MVLRQSIKVCQETFEVERRVSHNLKLMQAEPIKADWLIKENILIFQAYAAELSPALSLLKAKLSSHLMRAETSDEELEKDCRLWGKSHPPQLFFISSGVAGQLEEELLEIAVVHR